METTERYPGRRRTEPIGYEVRESTPPRRQGADLDSVTLDELRRERAQGGIVPPGTLYNVGE